MLTCPIRTSVTHTHLRRRLLAFQLAVIALDVLRETRCDDAREDDDAEGERRLAGARGHEPRAELLDEHLRNTQRQATEGCGSMCGRAERETTRNTAGQLRQTIGARTLPAELPPPSSFRRALSLKVPALLEYTATQ
jgi:hypothetical protein